MIRIYASEEGFAELYLRATLIAQYKNPQLFYNLQDIPDAERLAEIQAVEDEMKELMS